MDNSQKQKRKRGKATPDSDEPSFGEDDGNEEYNEHAMKGQNNDDSGDGQAEDVDIDPNEEEEDDIEDSLADKDGNRKKDTANSNTGQTKET